MRDRRLVIDRPARPTRVKRLTAVCEGMRIIQNRSQYRGWQSMTEELTEFSGSQNEIFWLQ